MDTALKFTSKKWKGIFRGWYVTAQGIGAVTMGGKKYKANELCFVTFVKPVDPNASTKRRQLSTPPIFLSNLIQRIDYE